MNRLNKIGFTLMEVMVAMVVGSIFLAGSFAFFNSQQKNFKVQEEITEMQQMARVAMDLFTREIRMAGYNPTQNIAVSRFVSTTTTSIQFQIDWDANGDALGLDEDVTYSFANSQIIRTTVNPNSSELLLDNVINLTFSYYLISDDSGIRTATYGPGFDDDCDGVIDDANELVLMPADANACIDAIANAPTTQLDRDYIRVVDVGAVMRTESADLTYTSKYGYGNYRTVQMSSKIRPRNLGI